MSIAFVIYLASISAGIQLWLGIMAFGFIAAAVFLERLFPFIILSAVFGAVCAAVPSSSDIYKIAGVTEQQKAAIDASGAIVQKASNPTQYSAPAHQ